MRICARLGRESDRPRRSAYPRQGSRNRPPHFDDASNSAPSCKACHSPSTATQCPCGDRRYAERSLLCGLGGGRMSDSSRGADLSISSRHRGISAPSSSDGYETGDRGCASDAEPRRSGPGSDIREWDTRPFQSDQQGDLAPPVGLAGPRWRSGRRQRSGRSIETACRLGEPHI
jgi:hypothetical protein